jgi:hypothetical protein
MRLICHIADAQLQAAEKSFQEVDPFVEPVAIRLVEDALSPDSRNRSYMLSHRCSKRFNSATNRTEHKGRMSRALVAPHQGHTIMDELIRELQPELPTKHF